jgi:hypothetical protein
MANFNAPRPWSAALTAESAWSTVRLSTEQSVPEEASSYHYKAGILSNGSCELSVGTQAVGLEHTMFTDPRLRPSLNGTFNSLW